MLFAQSAIRTGQLASGLSAQSLAVDERPLPASCPTQDWCFIPDYQETAAMRSKEAITAMVIGAAALAAQPSLMVPSQGTYFEPYGSVPALCLGTCTATAVSGSSTCTPLQSVRQNDSFTSNTTVFNPLLGPCNDVVYGRVAVLPGHPQCTGLDDSTSPLSASSRVGIGGVPTPCGSEALSGARLGGKRSYEQAFEQQQLQQQWQALQQQHLQEPQAAGATQQTQSQQPLFQQFIACQQQVAVQRQPAVLHRQQAQQQQVDQTQLSSHAAAGRVGGAERGQLSSAILRHQLAQPKQWLVSQNSVTSSTSSGASVASCVAPSGAGAASQQYHHNQQRLTTSLLANGICLQQQQQQQQQHHQQQAWLLGAVPTAVVTAKAGTFSTSSISWTAYLQRLQQQSRQPPCKRAATTAACAAAAAAIQAPVQQQQLPAPAAPVMAAVMAKSDYSCSLMSAAGSSPGLPWLQAPVSDDSRLLGWAGQLLNCQLSDAYHLAQHIYTRAAVQLDDMLLITLGVTQPMDKVAMLVSLWMATKLEGHRRQVVGCSKLATALQMVPWAVTSVELHVMQALEWRPYAGLAGRSSAAVSEL